MMELEVIDVEQQLLSVKLLKQRNERRRLR